MRRLEPQPRTQTAYELLRSHSVRHPEQATQSA
jgi:hypothetical protein